MKRQVQLDLRVFRRLFVILVSLLVLVSSARAQSNITDGTTPPGIAPGAPAGSYPLTDIEVLNVYNGNVSLRFPLITLGGRGSARHTVTLPVEQRWTVDHTQDLFGGNTYHSPSPGWWQAPGRYAAGRLLARHVTSWACPDASSQTLTLTRVTFSAPDGTEYELRDAATDGDRRWSICAFDQPHFNRGRIFKTADGTAGTFISDADVYDSIFSGFITPMTGHLMLRDGTRYRFDNGDVTWIRDRNGNKISFSYNGFVSMTITDSLNRQVLIEYYVTEPSPYGLCDRITFKGFGGANRVIRVSIRNLSAVLRTTQSYDYSTVKTYLGLFPELNAAQSNDFDPFDMIGSVWLPDGRRYQIFYNVYGEVARVILPTGGALEYDWEGGLQGGSLSGVTTYDEIFRKVITRRTYTDSSLSSLISKSTYSKVPFATTSDVTVENKDANDTVLSRSKHYFFTNPLTSIGGGDPLGYPTWKDGKESQTEALNTDWTVLRRETSTWQQRAPVGWWVGDPDFAPSNDPRVVESLTTLNDATPNLVSKRTSINPNDGTTGFDLYNNQTDVWEYDFGNGSPGALSRHSHTHFLTTNPVNGKNYATDNSVHLRSLPDQQSVYDANGVEQARTAYEYDKHDTSAGHALLVGRSNITQLDSGFTTAYTYRGNVTQATRYLLSVGVVTGTITTYQQYDIAGSAVKVIDGKNNPPTILEFDDRYGTADDEAQLNNQNPTELSGGKVTYAFPTKVTNALGHIAYTQLDYYLGKPVNTEDANGTVTKVRYDDALDRPTQVVLGLIPNQSSPLQRRTLFTYSDAAHLITTEGDQTTFQDGALKSEVVYDGLGRTTETRHYAPEGVIYTTQSYDALGRVKQTYNPYRTTTEETYGYADTTYDALGRVTRVETFTGSGTSTGAVTTAYSESRVLVSDQAGKQRISKTDGLGRLTGVWEIKAVDSATETVSFPNHPEVTAGYRTSYVYDVLDDLAKVTQGVQTRYFMYDSLKRLIRARNPEQDINANIALSDPLTGNSQWCVKYEYDANSNLFKKTDPPNIITNYGYDELNRVTSRTYTNDPQTTPAVAYKYDGETLPTGFPAAFNRGYSTGRLVAVTYGGNSAGSYTGYDRLGQVTSSYQQTDSQNYGFGYVYDLAGEITSQMYPSGRVVLTDYDTVGRVAGVKNQATSSYWAGSAATDTANRIQYAAHGAVRVMKLGNGKWEHTNYNSRLQPEQIGLGTSGTDSSILRLDYTFGLGTTNNGNLQTQRIVISGSLDVTQNYTYDELNRLKTANESSGANWSQTYDYDRFGNRAVRAGSYIPNPRQTQTSNSPSDLSTLFNQTNNRITATTEYAYDFAGNLTSMPDKMQGVAADTMTYDAENRQKTFNGTVGQYFYDGDGHRVKKIDNDGTTVFVYNVGGQLIAEYHSDPVPPAEGGGGTSYLTTDHLGSTRVVTKSDGTVKTRYDYLPFGEELGATVGQRTTGMGYSAPDGTNQKFTQKERDNESGLDYFLARYYSSAQGRFTSVDPVSGNRSDAQSWNGYAYSRNNPLKYVDPTGTTYRLYDLDGNYSDHSDQNVNDYRKNDGAVFKKGNIYDKDGNQIGTYRRLSDDSQSDLYNQTVFGLAARASAMNQAIGGFAVGTAVVGTGVGGAAYVGGVALGGTGVTTLGLSSGGGTVAGLYGTTSAATLQSLASSGGPTVQVVTNLTQAPVAGQALSTATGNGATALANSFARTGGQLFRAEIPKALMRELTRTGLAREIRHASGTIEIRFAAQATRFITQFFK